MIDEVKPKPDEEPKPEEPCDPGLCDMPEPKPKPIPPQPPKKPEVEGET